MSSEQKPLVLMNTNRVQRSLKRMAHEIVEKNGGDKSVLLFGIDDRGYATARALAHHLQAITENEVEILQMPIKKGPSEKLFDKLDSEKARGRYIIVVDDVIFSGQTMFVALKKIVDYFNPPEIHTAVMIDRGHRKFPIKAEFAGLELPTKLNEHVSVLVDEKKVEQVILENSENE